MSRSRIQRTLAERTRDATPLSRFLRASDGGAMIEHVLLLALIVGGIFLGAEFLGVTVQRAFGEVNTGIVSPATGSGGETVAARRGGGNETSAFGRMAQITGRFTGLADWRTILNLSSVGVLVWYLLRQRRLEQGRRSEKKANPAQEVSPSVKEATFQKRQDMLKILQANREALFENRVVVRHLMSKSLQIVSPRTTADKTAALMKDQQLRHALVCDHDGALIGIISNRDLIRTDAKTAADLMTARPVTVSPDTPVNQVVTLLIYRSISCLPVVEDGRPCGVLTTTDLMMALQCTFQVLQTSGETILPSQTDDWSEGENDDAPDSDPALIGAGCD